MTNLRKLARGKPCMIRLPGCDGGGETTVLAHYRMPGYCGTGLKPDDLAFGAWACDSCHSIVDERTRITGYTRAELKQAHLEGVLRTIHKLTELGVIKT